MRQGRGLAEHECMTQRVHVMYNIKSTDADMLQLDLQYNSYVALHVRYMCSMTQSGAVKAARLLCTESKSAMQDQDSVRAKKTYFECMLAGNDDCLWPKPIVVTCRIDKPVCNQPNLH